MERIFKFIKISIINILFISIIFLSLCIINNKIQLKKEANILCPPGKLVNVNNKRLHIYTEGKGDFTCVFMSGLGNVAPSIELKSLYKNMSDKYRIAVIDRAGYGFSDNSNDSRDIDTIVDETRKTLTLSGEKPPYILFPHSISGVEAIYWAQKYPNEVKAIMGLDIGYPEAYIKEGAKTSDLFIINAQALLTKCGVHRLLPSIALEKAVLDSNFLSEKDKKLYKALTYKNLLSNDVVNEFKSLEKNSHKSLALKLPTQTPICIFVAVPLTKEERTKKGYLIKKRNKYFNEYISHFEKGKIISIPGKHSIYLYSPKIIAKESKIFLENIEDNS